MNIGLTEEEELNYPLPKTPPPSPPLSPSVFPMTTTPSTQLTPTTHNVSTDTPPVITLTPESRFTTPTPSAPTTTPPVITPKPSDPFEAEGEPQSPQTPKIPDINCDNEEEWINFEKSLEQDIASYRSEESSSRTETSSSSSSYTSSYDADFFDPSVMEAEINETTDTTLSADMDAKFENIINDEEQDSEEFYRKYKMEDNMMKMKSQASATTFSQQDSERFIKITQNLYQNITRVWKIADKLGKNIKELGNKYRMVCLENKSYKLKYERLCIKIKILMKDKAYLEDVKKRYFQYRKEYEAQVHKSEKKDAHIKTLEANIGTIQAETHMAQSKHTRSSEKKDAHIKQLEHDINMIRQVNQMDKLEIKKLKEKYEILTSELNIKMNENKERIDRMTADSDETKKHLSTSSDLIGNILEKQNCDTMTGGGAAKVNKRIKSLENIQKYMDPAFSEIIAVHNNQWGSLTDDIHMMNEIMSTISADDCAKHNIPIPPTVTHNDILTFYLLFLYQLSVMKVIPDEDCHKISTLLGLPKTVRTCTALKKFFKDDTALLKEMIHGMKK